MESNNLIFKESVFSLHFFILLASLVFVGGDLLSVELGGLTIRLVTILIVAGWLFLVVLKINSFRVDRGLCLVAMAFSFAMLMSVPFSVDKYRSVAYTAWGLFTFVVLVPYFYQSAKRINVEDIIRIWFFSFRIQVFLLVFEVICRIFFGIKGRPHLWFYEPSYAAICISSYFGSSLYLFMQGRKEFKKDVFISAVGCLILISATAVFAISFGMFLCLLLAKNKVRNWALSLITLIVFVGTLEIFLSDTDAYHLLLGFMSNTDGEITDAFQAILFRSGTRVVRFIWGWEIMMSHMPFGIGFGADQTFTSLNAVPDAAAIYLSPWDDVVGNPIVNPFVEAGATMGLLGFVSMGGFFFFFMIRFLGLNRSQDNSVVFVKAIGVGFLTMFFALQFEGTFLRYYVWSVAGLFFGAVSQINSLGVASAFNHIDADTELR